MLNIITITSIEATIPQTEINPCNDYQTPSLNNYITDSFRDSQENGNMQSVTNIYKFNKKSTYFSIKINDVEYFNPFQGVGVWEQFDSKIHFANMRKYDRREYLYCTKSNRIYNKPIVRTSSQGYKSPKIKMVVDNEVKIQIFVNDPETEKFDTECIARGKFILFYNLIGDEREVYVSSLIYFFKYYESIYCSIKQLKPGFTIKMVEDLIQRNPKDFIKDFVLKSFELTPEYAVQQVEKILEYENCVAELLNLKDAAYFKENGDTRTHEKEKQKRLNIVFVNKGNIYEGKYWQSENNQICNSPDTCCHIYSINDKMMTKPGISMNSIGNKLPLIWRMIGHNILNTFQILNQEAGKYVRVKIARRKIFNIFPICFNQQTTHPQKKYVFFRRKDNKKTIFCVKFLMGKFQTVNDCDIHEIIFILETTNVFYFLTHNGRVPKFPLLTIIEESEVSFEDEDSNDNVSEYETKEENVLNLADN